MIQMIVVIERKGAFGQKSALGSRNLKDESFGSMFGDIALFAAINKAAHFCEVADKIVQFGHGLFESFGGLELACLQRSQKVFDIGDEELLTFNLQFFIFKLAFAQMECFNEPLEDFEAVGMRCHPRMFEKLACRGPFVGILVQTAGDKLDKRFAPTVGILQSWRVAFANENHRFQHVFGRMRRLAFSKFNRGNAKGPNICAGIVGGAVQYLGTHIQWRANGTVVRTAELSTDAKVSNLTFASIVDEDIFRLQIPVN